MTNAKDARALRYRALGASASGAPPSGDYPPSLVQCQMWQAAEDLPKTVGASYRLSGPLRLDALARAVRAVVLRHASLHTYFPAVDGAPVARVDPSAAVELEIVDAPAEEAAQVLRRARAAGLSLVRGPLCRFLVQRCGPDDHFFYFIVQHIVCDAHAVALVLRELAAAYNAELSGTPLVADELRLRAKDIGAWQRSWLDEQARSDYRAFWTRVFGERAPQPPLRSMRPRPKGQRSFAVRHHQSPLRADLRRLIALGSAGQRRFTAPTALLSAWIALLHLETGDEAPIAGFFSAGRTRETISIVSNFAVLLALRVPMTPAMSFLDLTERVGELTTEAIDHEDVPPLIALPDLERDGPRFRFYFNCVRSPARRAFALHDLTVAVGPPFDRDNTVYDLTARAFELSGEHVDLSVHYNSELIDDDALRAAIRRYEAVLDAASAAPDRPLADLGV